MQCPNCHAEVRDGAAFCGSCGATIEQQVAPPAVTMPLQQPTAPMPAPTVPDQAAYDQAVYAQQMAEYERQKAAYDQAQYAQQQAAYQQQAPAGQYAQQPPAAPRKKKTGCVVAIVIILILLLVGCSVGGYFAYKAFKDKAEEALEITTPDSGDGESGESGESPEEGNLLDSYATAGEAVEAQLQASGAGDWVYQVYDEGDGYATYWAGPPNSEFVDQIYLEQNPDGTWSVIEVSGIEYGGDVSEGAGSAADEAMSVVDQHLSYVMSDMGLEAQSLTIDPFRSDAAAAQVSAGGFDSYTIDGYEEQSDGTFWVQTTQSWYGGPAEGWQYYVVPTEAGYRIANIEFIQ